MSNKEKAKEEIKLLVEKYNRLVETGKVKSYNEEMTKKDFILPLFRALGWSIEDGEEVTAEEKISKGRVDYAFRIQSIPKLFLEAKSLKEDLDKIEFAEQAINYAWHKGATWAVLTDFEGIKVFNAEWKSNNPLQNLFFSLSCTQFLERFEQLWLLSRECLESGVIDKEAEKWGKKAKKVPVDKQLLSDLTRFRELLTKNILKNNVSKNLSAEELDEAIQRIIDRLIFIRTIEDKQLEAPILQSLIREDQTKRVYKKLNNAFRKIDDIYNSKLFAFHLCEELNIDDDVLEKIIIGLFKTSDEAVHYDFSAIDADVLGNIYEQYLGYLLKKTEKRGKLVEGKAHRKEQGIYYTPTYVVDYIVKNTIGELAKDKKIDLTKIKVLDPACGSGSFLMKTFDYLVTLDKKKKGVVEQTKLDTSGVSATYGRKIEILKNNIFGVDLDPKAVEIAQLNLLLKATEKKHRLPTLQENIKVGNSLIDDSAVSSRAFKWEEQFKEIISNGGFDVVVGNPPYVNNRNLPKTEKAFIEKNYKTAYQQYDLYVLFYELAFKLVKEGGYIGLITPNKFAITKYGFPLRKLLLDYTIVKVVDVSQLSVFGDVSTYPYIVILQKVKPKTNSKIKLYSPSSFELEKSSNQEMKQSELTPEKQFVFNINSSQREIISKIDGEKVIEIYRAKPTSKEISNSGECFALTNRDIVKYGINSTNNRIRRRKEWLINAPAILMKKICFVPTATLLNNDSYIPVNTIYVIHSKDNQVKISYLLGILNSKVIAYYTRTKYGVTAMRGGFIELRTFEIEDLPIKTVPELRQQPLIKLVDKMLSLNKRLNELKDKSTDEKAKIEVEIKKTDQEIDELVYKLYGITEEEKKIIEESLK